MFNNLLSQTTLQKPVVKASLHACVEDELGNGRNLQLLA